MTESATLATLGYSGQSEAVTSRPGISPKGQKGKGADKVCVQVCMSRVARIQGHRGTAQLIDSWQMADGAAAKGPQFTVSFALLRAF